MEFNQKESMKISMIWNMLVVQILRKILLTTTIIQNEVASSISKFAMPLFSSIQSPMDPGDYFVTVTISKFEDCTKLCYSTTGCEFGNYRIHGHVCYLTYVLGSTPFTINEENIPGFLSWTKTSLNAIYTSDNSPCHGCSDTKSCKTNYDLGTCETYACGKPSNPSSFNIVGNVYTVRGKLINGTCNSGNDVNFITCDEDGVWKEQHGNCGYSRHTLTDGSNIVVKIVHADVDQATALSKCQQEGANLTTVFTLEKLNLLKSLFGSSRENYWADARRYNETDWQTSHGHSQPMISDIWAENTANAEKTDNCARLRYTKRHKLDDIYCDELYSYICEIQL